MGKGINRLTARQVSAASRPGYHPDGGGLYLQVTRAGAKSWVFRFSRAKRPREMGLGSAQVVSLLEARQRAQEARGALSRGDDPIELRNSRRAAPTGATWGQAKADYIALRAAEWKNDDQRQQWEASLTAYGPVDATSIAAVDTAVVLSCLRPIWQTKTETATRVRGRIERILDFARVNGWREGENPARWRGHLDKLLPRPTKVARVSHHAAMPYRDLPAFWRTLRERDGLARHGLQFTILTVARTSEVTGLHIAEVDGDVWTVPAARMKAGIEHQVPLVPEAIALLQRARSAHPFPLSENGMLALLQRQLGQPFTVHGFRSSFRDWAGDETDYPREVIEMALAHQVRDETEAAYRRSRALGKRRELMKDWAAYLASG